MIQAGIEQFALRSVHLLIPFGIMSNCLPIGSSRSLCIFIRRAIKQSVVIIEVYHLSTTYKILSNILLLTPYTEDIIGDHQYGV